MSRQNKVVKFVAHFKLDSCCFRALSTDALIRSDLWFSGWKLVSLTVTPKWLCYVSPPPPNPRPGCLLCEVNRLVWDCGWCSISQETLCSSDKTILKLFPCVFVRGFFLLKEKKKEFTCGSYRASSHTHAQTHIVYWQYCYTYFTVWIVWFKLPYLQYCWFSGHSLTLIELLLNNEQHTLQC